MHNGAQCLKNDEALSLVTLINNSIASRGGGGGGDSRMIWMGMVVGNFEFNP